MHSGSWKMSIQVVQRELVQYRGYSHVNFIKILKNGHRVRDDEDEGLPCLAFCILLFRKTRGLPLAPGTTSERKISG